MEDFSDNSSLVFLKTNWLILILGLGGLLLLGFGTFSYFFPQSTKNDLVFTTGQDEAVNASSAASLSPTKTITIDVGGAVASPSVYTLPEKSRMRDALKAAGGLTKQADKQKIAKTMNMAAYLADGGKLYFPSIGEEGIVLQSGVSSTFGGKTGLINLNTAGASELDLLPGVGPATAEKIIANRPYASPQDLVSKKVLSQSVLEKIKSKITTE